MSTSTVLKAIGIVLVCTGTMVVGVCLLVRHFR